MTDCSNPDFKLGNMAAELVDYTLDICGKDESKTPRFPERFYDSYVKEIVTLSVGILAEIYAANSVKNDAEERKKHREAVLGKCGAMAKLVFSAYKHKWISDKQNTTWQKKINSIYFVVNRWQ